MAKNKMGRKDASLKINLGVPFKTNKRASKPTSKRASRRDNMKKKCTGWAIVTTMEREDGTWYTETITDIDDDTASSVDNFLTEYCENDNQQASGQKG